MSVLSSPRTTSYRINQTVLTKVESFFLQDCKYFKVYVTCRPPRLLMSVPRQLLGHIATCCGPVSLGLLCLGKKK